MDLTEAATDAVCQEAADSTTRQRNNSATPKTEVTDAHDAAATDASAVDDVATVITTADRPDADRADADNADREATVDRVDAEDRADADREVAAEEAAEARTTGSTRRSRSASAWTPAGRYADVPALRANTRPATKDTARFTSAMRATCGAELSLSDTRRRPATRRARSAPRRRPGLADTGNHANVADVAVTPEVSATPVKEGERPTGSAISASKWRVTRVTPM